MKGGEINMTKKNQILNRVPRKLAIQNKVDDDKTVKLSLHGDIGTAWYDSISLKDIQRTLKGVTAETLEVHINSYGGDVFESIAIHNYLMYERTEKIVTFTDGIAASGGSIIFMAGDDRIMPANTQLMIHNPWTVTWGNAKELRLVANRLEKTQTSLEETYMAKFVGAVEELKTLLDQEEHLTAEESLAFGFATEVVREVVIEDPKGQEETIKNTLFEKYAASKVKPQDQEIPGNKETANTNIIKNFINNF